jgi:glycosyltransferase involved in cell wall biosynthesis
MKILTISYLFPNKIYPNYGIFVLNRLKAVNKFCDIKVINPVPWFPYHYRFDRYKNYHKIPLRETIQGVDVYHPRFPVIPRYLKSIDAMTFCMTVIPLALRLKEDYPFDLIDLHWTYPDLPAGYILSKITGRPFLATVRGQEALYFEEPGVRKHIVGNLLKKTSRIIALSARQKKSCQDCGCPDDKISVIRNGVDHERFYLINQETARVRLGLPRDKRIILAVGSLVYGKGFDRIIKALSVLIKEYPDTQLYIIGSEGAAGYYKKELNQLVGNLKVVEYVNFTGEVNNYTLLYWYNAADIFCLASRSEGSPNVLTEALSCGCPAVATAVGSVPEIMEEDFMGVVVPEQGDLLDGLRKGLSRHYDRKRISNHVRQYDWDWCAKQVISVYNKVLQGRDE